MTPTSPPDSSVLRRPWLVGLTLAVAGATALAAFRVGPADFAHEEIHSTRTVTSAIRPTITEEARVEAARAQVEAAEEALRRAEAALEAFRVGGIRAPVEDEVIVPRQDPTGDPVFARYFDMRVRLDQVNRDLARVDAHLGEASSGSLVSIEALEIIPAVASSSEMRRVLEDVVTTRHELRMARSARDRDREQLLVERVRTMEEAVVAVLQAIRSELVVQQLQLQTAIEAASGEPQEIDRRHLEESRLLSRIDDLEVRLRQARARFEAARRAAEAPTVQLRVVDRAVVPTVPSRDLRLPFALAAFLGTLVAGLTLALSPDGWRPRSDDLMALTVVVLGAGLAVTMTARLLDEGPRHQDTRERVLPPVREAPPIARVDPAERSRPSAEPARLIPVAGNNQIAEPGHLVADRVMVMVVDKNGDPVEGALVEFSVATGSGMAAPQWVRTDERGWASALWRLGPEIGTNTLTATVEGMPDVVTFTARGMSYVIFAPQQQRAVSSKEIAR